MRLCVVWEKERTNHRGSQRRLYDVHDASSGQYETHSVLRARLRSEHNKVQELGLTDAGTMLLLSVLEFSMQQRVVAKKLQQRPSTDTVTLSSSAQATPTAVGPLLAVVETDHRAESGVVLRHLLVDRGEPLPHGGPSAATRTAISARTATGHKPVVNPNAVAQRPNDSPSSRSSSTAQETNRLACGVP